MAASKLLVALCLAVFLSGASPHVEGQNGEDFDLLLLVRQWGPTFCLRKSNNCTRKAYGAFTLHGLWPERSNGSWPQYCQGADYSESDIDAKILNQMNCEWPSYTGTSSQFWTYEYRKHGKCAVGNVFDAAKDYFAATLKLNDAYDVQVALESEGIDPHGGAPVEASKVREALNKAWGVTSRMSCSSGGLNEVWMCFGLDLTPVDCPKAIGATISPCPLRISFPVGHDVPDACEPYFPPAHGPAIAPKVELGGEAGQHLLGKE